VISVKTAAPRIPRIRKLLCATSCGVLIAGALSACGGGGGGGDIQPSDEGPLVTSGRIYPAAAGVVLVEYNKSGMELQRSTATGADGSFQFSRRLLGARIEAVYTSSSERVPPIYSTRLGNGAPITQLEITPLTTWYDQLMVGGVTATDAATDIRGLVTTNCPALTTSLDSRYLYASATVPAADHDWLLGAAAAYMQAARKLGVGPKVDFSGWSSALDRHGDTLSQLCAFSSAVSDPTWAATQADRLKREAQIATPDSAQLAAAIATARSQGLSYLALQIQQSEFPAQTMALQTVVNVMDGHLALGSDFVMAQYLFSQAAKSDAQALDVSAAGTDSGIDTKASVAISSAGVVVSTLKGTVTASGSGAVASLRLENDGVVDKTVRLSVNGQDLADLPGIIQQIVATPVAYSGEPLYRKAWRYLIAHRRDTQPLAISFFQFQPDLWLRSVGSSYCEAQASVLYRIWAAMGYTARVHALTGHVTVEIQVDGHWQVFDPYLGVYYTDRNGQIVGVAELEQDPTLITNPQTPLLPLSAVAYSSNVAQIFASTSDNYIGTDYMTTEPEPLDSTVQLPAGGYLELNAATNVTLPSSETGYTVDMSTMKLWVPPGYTGMIRLPLLLLDVQGTGSLQLIGHTLTAAGTIDPMHGLAALGSLDTTATHPSIHDVLQNFYFHASSDVGVTEVQVNSSGADGLTLTLMANPLLFPSPQQLTVRADGADMEGLHLVATPPQ